MIEVDALQTDLKEPEGAKRIRERVGLMLNKVDSLVQKLEAERKSIDETVADPAAKDAIASKRFVLLQLYRIVCPYVYNRCCHLTSRLVFLVIWHFVIHTIRNVCTFVCRRRLYFV